MTKEEKRRLKLITDARCGLLTIRVILSELEEACYYSTAGITSFDGETYSESQIKELISAAEKLDKFINFV